ncbi:1-phosphofructokinase family hexose kinase [Nocardia sp. NPDC020380]|uniref:1-phosphofructokinase family hexose kinase n=1 Tax=Nocardia sp. NPDC020380 TaxID=3364309 RepID=UPI0037B1CA19
MAPVILTVTLNPAYDMTYRLDTFARGRVQRVTEVEQRIGGKGINVSRVLGQLGIEALATGFSDEAFASAAAQDLPADFIPVLPRVRRTVVITESADGTTTGLWEPGARPNHPEAAMDRLRLRITTLLPTLRGMVISGSLPSGVDPAFPAELAGTALAAGIPTICDVDGPALVAAAAIPGVVLVPNEDELARLTASRSSSSPVTESAETACSHPAATTETVITTAQPLLDAGVRAVIATRGPAGMIACTQSGSWSAALPEPMSGNPTGAGDAAAAAVIAALATSPQPDWPTILTDAVATSAAAVAVPVAGQIDLALREGLSSQIIVTRARRAAQELPS